MLALQAARSRIGDRQATLLLQSLRVPIQRHIRHRIQRYAPVLVQMVRRNDATLRSQERYFGLPDSTHAWDRGI